MKLTLLALFVGFLTLCAKGHIIDDAGNCIADCHTAGPAVLTGTNHAVVDLKA